MRIKPRFLLFLVVATILGYLFWGRMFHADSRLRGSERAALAETSSGAVRVAVLWAKAPTNDFLEGCQVGAQLGNEGAKRPIELVPVQVDGWDDDDFQDRLSGVFNRDPRIVAAVAAVPDRLVGRTEVVCESFGVALVLTNLESPLVAGPRYRYTIRMNPDYREYARAITSGLSLLKPREARPLRLGIFFNARTSMGTAGVNLILEECQTQNSLVDFVQALRREIDQGIVNPSTSARQLRDDIAFQTGLSRKAGVMNSFLQRFASNQEIESDLPLSEILKRAGKLDSKLNVRFVQAYLPDQNDYRPELAKLALSEIDALVMASDLRGTSVLTRQLRDNECRAPIFSLDYQRVDVLQEALGPAAGDLYMLSGHDPSTLTMNYPALVNAFRQRLSSGAEGAGGIGEMGLMGHDSVRLLGDVLAKTGRSVPEELINTIKFGSIEFDALGDRFTIGPDGTPVDKELFLLKLDGKNLITVTPAGEE